MKRKGSCQVDNVNWLYQTNRFDCFGMAVCSDRQEEKWNSKAVGWASCRRSGKGSRKSNWEAESKRAFNSNGHKRAFYREIWEEQTWWSFWRMVRASKSLNWKWVWIHRNFLLIHPLICSNESYPSESSPNESAGIVWTPNFRSALSKAGSKISDTNCILIS